MKVSFSRPAIRRAQQRAVEGRAAETVPGRFGATKQVSHGVYERGPTLRVGDWLAVVPKALEHRCKGAAHAARQIDFSWRAGLFTPSEAGAHEICWARRDPELSIGAAPDGVPAPARGVAPADGAFAPQDIRLSDGSPVVVEVKGAAVKEAQMLERAPPPIELESTRQGGAGQSLPEDWLAGAAQPGMHRIRLRRPP